MSFEDIEGEIVVREQFIADIKASVKETRESGGSIAIITAAVAGRLVRIGSLELEVALLKNKLARLPQQQLEPIILTEGTQLTPQNNTLRNLLLIGGAILLLA